MLKLDPQMSNAMKYAQFIVHKRPWMESFAFPNIIKMTKIKTFLGPFGCQSFSICQSFMKWQIKLHFLNSVNHLKHQTLAFIHRKLERPSKLKGK